MFTGSLDELMGESSNGWAYYYCWRCIGSGEVLMKCKFSKVAKENNADKSCQACGKSLVRMAPPGWVVRIGELELPNNESA